jgi:2-methylcitrate dehydratase PrpD
MGTVLGLIAVHGKAGLTEFHELALSDPQVAAFRAKVGMTLDAEVDSAYPKRWLGRISVTTVDGRQLRGAIDEPKGDPGNTLSRPELEDKFLRLLQFSGARLPAQGRELIARVWNLRELTDLSHLV